MVDFEGIVSVVDYLLFRFVGRQVQFHGFECMTSYRGWNFLLRSLLDFIFWVQAVVLFLLVMLDSIYSESEFPKFKVLCFPVWNFIEILHISVLKKKSKRKK